MVSLTHLVNIWATKNGCDRNRSIFLALETTTLSWLHNSDNPKCQTLWGYYDQKGTVIPSKWPNITTGAGSVKSSAGT